MEDRKENTKKDKPVAKKKRTKSSKGKQAKRPKGQEELLEYAMGVMDDLSRKHSPIDLKFALGKLDQITMEAARDRLLAAGKSQTIGKDGEPDHSSDDDSNGNH